MSIYYESDNFVNFLNRVFFFLKFVGTVKADVIGKGCVSIVGTCEHDNERSVVFNFGKFLLVLWHITSQRKIILRR